MYYITIQRKVKSFKSYKLWGAMCFKDTKQKCDHCYAVKHTFGLFNILALISLT